MKTVKIYLPLLLVLVLVCSLNSPAQRRPDGRELEKKELIVAYDDELAPVNAIQAALDARLAAPIEELDLEIIMEGENFFGTAPRNLQWDGDGSRFWFSWKKWDEDEPGTWQYTIATGELIRLSKDEAELLPVNNAIWNDANTLAVFEARNSVYLYDAASKTTRALISGLQGIRPLAFSADGKNVFLQFSNNLVAFPINGGDATMAVLTDIRSGRPQDDEPKTVSQQWVKKQQLALFSVLRNKYDEQEKERARRESFGPKPVYIGEARARNMVPSPDGSFAGLFLFSPARTARMTEMPDYVTISGYTEVQKIRTKVGDEDAASSMMIIDVATGLSTTPDLGLEDRKVNIFTLKWSPDGKTALVQIRAEDNKDVWFATITPVVDTTGEAPELKCETKILLNDHDDAWVNYYVARGYDFLPDGSGFYFISERDGHLNLYTCTFETGEITRMTPGNYQVYRPRLSADKTEFVFEASIPDPHTVFTYALPLAGGEPRQLTSGFGRTDSTLSPDGAYNAMVAASLNVPDEVYLTSLTGPESITKITDSPSPAFKSITLKEPETVYFTARDGVQVPAQVYLPDTPHPNKPGIVFVHGAGYMQNVINWWRGSSYGRVYIFHNLLTRLGYTVIDIDYRGSAGYGRDWRTAIYRYMGGKDFTDQVDGANFLVEKYGVDPTRIGVYGGSYGGFMTLMVMFNAPDTFAAGAAMRPVTDWAAYNNGYTGNILNKPQDDPEAYIKSSPIYYAEGLKGALLICHGIVDDNVHFQGSVRLVQRLIELRKENWEFAIYPVERHGFRQPSSWVDEYRRILKLFDDNLKNRE